MEQGSEKHPENVIDGICASPYFWPQVVESGSKWRPVPNRNVTPGRRGH